MSRLKWLYPGMLVKRWIFLTIFGIVMISMGFVMVIFERSPQNKTTAGLIIIAGIMCVIFAVKRVLKSFMTALLPARYDSGMVDKMFERRILEKGPKIVVIGGGTGLSTLLLGIKHLTSNITAIVTVADDGGSSGRLREEFGVLPPGDIRNCLVALSDAEDLMGALFQYRFKEGNELHGHNFGNLFITALSQITGDFTKAIRESSKVLAIRGDVFPATLERISLAARRENGMVTVGESNIRHMRESRIDRINLKPDNCAATPESVMAIENADMIILGPGSLYTSVMPNLLIDGIRDAIVKSEAAKVYICNVMTEAGETDNYSVSDHASAIIKHTSDGIMDFCVTNITPIPEKLYEKYKLEEQYFVKVEEKDEKWFKERNIKLIRAPIASMEQFVRHDSYKLSNAIKGIFNS